MSMWLDLIENTSKRAEQMSKEESTQKLVTRHAPDIVAAGVALATGGEPATTLASKVATRELSQNHPEAVTRVAVEIGQAATLAVIGMVATPVVIAAVAGTVAVEGAKKLFEKK